MHGPCVLESFTITACTHVIDPPPASTWCRRPQIQRLERLLFQSAGTLPPKREPPRKKPPPRNGRSRQQDSSEEDEEEDAPPPALDLYSEMRKYADEELPDVHDEMHMEGWTGWSGWLTGAASYEDSMRKEEQQQGGEGGAARSSGGGDYWKEAKKKGANKGISYDKAQKIVVSKVHNGEVTATVTQLLKAGPGGRNGAVGHGQLGLWALPLQRRHEVAAAMLQELRTRWAGRRAHLHCLYIQTTVTAVLPLAMQPYSLGCCAYGGMKQACSWVFALRALTCYATLAADHRITFG